MLFKRAEKVDLEKGKRIFLECGCSYVIMDERGLYKEFKACNVPEEMRDQWTKERFKEYKQDFQKSCEEGSPDFYKLKWLCDQTNSVDPGIIRDTYDMVVNNSLKMGLENELKSYCYITNPLMFEGVLLYVGMDNFKYILEKVRDRLNIIFQSNPEYQQKFPHLYDMCDQALKRKIVSGIPVNAPYSV